MDLFPRSDIFMFFAQWVSHPCVLKALIYKDFRLNFKAPVRGLFAGDETVTPNGASDIMPYVGRKRALGCALFPMY